MRYVAIVDGREHVVTLDPNGGATVGETFHDIGLESIDGGAGAEESLVCLFVDDESHELFVERHGSRYYISIAGTCYEVRIVEEQRHRASASRGECAGRVRERSPEDGRATVTSPMPGIVLDVLVEERQAVQAGDRVAILEAMKMENEIRAPCAGMIASVHVVPGQTVNLSDVIVDIGAPPDGEFSSQNA